MGIQYDGCHPSGIQRTGVRGFSPIFLDWRTWFAEPTFFVLFWVFYEISFVYESQHLATCGLFFFLHIIRSHIYLYLYFVYLTLTFLSIYWFFFYSLPSNLATTIPWKK